MKTYILITSCLFLFSVVGCKTKQEDKQVNMLTQPIPDLTEDSVGDSISILATPAHVLCDDLTLKTLNDIQPDGDVYEIVEQSPSFPGGEKAMYEWLSKNINYPETARDKNIQGRVTVRYVVDKKGEINDVVIARGVDPRLDEEALRVVKAMPKWIPGEIEGKSVNVRYTLPIQFKLE